MSAHTLVSTLQRETVLGLTVALVTITGSTSYDAGGSIIDLSSLFPSKVYTAIPVAVGAHASDVYRGMFVPGASSGPALGKLKIRDLGAAADAEASGDLSAHTLTLLCIGV